VGSGGPGFGWVPARGYSGARPVSAVHTNKW
jgi:hypothetical protein